MEVQDAMQVLEEMSDEAKNALIVTGFWSSEFSGKEIDVMKTLFLGTVQLLNQKTNALAVAIEQIDELREYLNPSDIDCILEKVNHAMTCHPFEEYTPLHTTVN